MGDPFYNSNAWRGIRMRVLKRDGWRCVWCGRSLRGKGIARIDHILERKKRPDLELDINNLRALCYDCDAKRHRDKGGWNSTKPKRIDARADGFPEGGDW